MIKKAEKKIYNNINDLVNIIKKEKLKNKKIVFTNGCFDLLHIGHAKYLEEAKNLGDILIVALNDDASVKRLKGSSRPLHTLYDRMLLIAHLASTDYILSFSEDTAINVIKEIKPDIYAKGGDVMLKNIPEKNAVEEYGGSIVILSLSHGHSSTNIINKAKKHL